MKLSLSTYFETSSKKCARIFSWTKRWRVLLPWQLVNRCSSCLGSFQQQCRERAAWRLPVESDSTGAASAVHTSPRIATRHVGPQEENHSASLRVLFSSSVRENRVSLNWVLQKQKQIYCTGQSKDTIKPTNQSCTDPLIADGKREKKKRVQVNCGWFWFYLWFGIGWQSGGSVLRSIV